MSKALKRSLSVIFVMVVCALLTASLPAVSEATILYAAPSAQGNGDCTAWQDACSLVTALSKASKGDQVWVKAGVHKPSVSNRNQAFVFYPGIKVYGGFNGTETSLNQRDWQTNLTILSGDIDDNDTNLDGNFIAETPSDIQGNNSYHVILCNSGCDAIIDGFVITSGQANDSGVSYGSLGGGMINFGLPELRNIVFQGNYAAGYGGAIYNMQDASISLTTVVFISNIAFNNSGGAIYNWGNNNLILTGVNFINNQANQYGGAIAGYSFHLQGTGLFFSNNVATNDNGGAISADTNSYLTIEEATFNNNSAGWQGGAISVPSGSLNILNSRFIQNSASYGGAIYADNLVFTNGVVSRNTAQVGAGIYVDTGGTLTNLSFSDNAADVYGGAITYHDNDPSGVLTIANSILWGNSAGISDPEVYRYFKTGTTTFAYSDIQGCGGSNVWDGNCGTDGGGNIDGDPVFIDPLNDDLRVHLSTSPVIDAGSNSLVPQGVISDLDGNSRFVDILSVPDTGSGSAPVVDMGAYEGYRYSLTVTKAGTGSGTVHVSGCLFAWDGNTGRCTLDEGQISLSASADTGSVFSGWSGTGSASTCTGTGACSFTITEDSEVTATFTATAVKVLSPNGGEAIPSGDIYTIQWQAPPTAHHFTLKLSMDNGMTWTTIASNITGNTYDWTVPVPTNNKRKCLIKVIAFNSSNVKLGADRSDGTFTIEVIKLLSPNGGESLTSGDSIPISWTINKTRKPIAKMIISYTLNGGLTWKTVIIFPGGGSGSWSIIWTVPTVSTKKTKCKVKVVLKDSAGNVIGSDLSDGFFTISPL